jgi:hypothetical protein
MSKAQKRHLRKSNKYWSRSIDLIDQ